MKGALVFVLLLAIGLAVGLPNLGDRDFWPPDEARYGGVAAEQARGGHHPLVPHLNGKLYPDKPAVYFLAIQGSAHVLNEDGAIDEAASRLPSVIAGALLVAIVGCWVTCVVCPGTGLLAGIVLLGFGLFSWQLRYVQMDMLLAGTCGLMMVAFWRTWNGGSAWWCTLGWLALTVGIAVKGPMALLVFAAVIVWALVSRRPRAFFNRGSLVGLIACAGVIVGGVLYIRTVPEGETYVDHLIGRHVVERAAKGLAHEKPWYAYLGIFPGSLLPLAPLFLLALQSGVRREISTKARPLVGFATLWMLLVLVVASTQPGKRSVYLLPIFPAAAIVLAILVNGARKADVRWPARYAGAVGILGCVLGGVCLGIGYDESALRWLVDQVDGITDDRVTALLERRAFDPFTDGFREGVLGAARWIAPSALVTVIVSFTLGKRAAVGCLAAFTAITIAAGCACIAPELDGTMSRRAAASALLRVETERGTRGPISFFHHLDEGVAFYVGRPIPEVPGQEPGEARLDHGKEEHRKAARAAVGLALATPGALMIAKARDLDRFGLVAGEHYREVSRTRVGRRWYVIMEAPR